MALLFRGGSKRPRRRSPHVSLMATPAALESRLELCIENERGSGRRRMKSSNGGGGGMFENQGRENKSKQSQKDRNVYFGVITDLLEERTIAPPAIIPPLSTLDSASPPHLISSSSLLSLQGCFFSVCLAVSSHLPPAYLSPSLALILLSGTLFILSFF